MQDNIYEQLNFELNEQQDLINKKKMMMGYLRLTSKQHDFSAEESNKILGALISIGTSKNQGEYEYYTENILAYIKELLSKNKVC
ncbi:hypothetical protein MKX83_23675 [Cytobacillus sp. FSL M8-0252]|uniref:hypothetical protein n=1 Tax=Cytobacillus sp. FSL M8-0252 TaxID=2921621 RepID=UPI0030FCAADF